MDSLTSAPERPKRSAVARTCSALTQSSSKPPVNIAVRPVNRGSTGVVGSSNPGRLPVSEPKKDRKSVVEGKSVSVRVDIGGRRSIKKKHQINKESREAKS